MNPTETLECSHTGLADMIHDVTASGLVVTRMATTPTGYRLTVQRLRPVQVELTATPASNLVSNDVEQTRIGADAPKCK